MTDRTTPPTTTDDAPQARLERSGAHVQGDGYTGTLMERMGIDITEVSPDGARGTMPVEGNVQPYGILHGGASAVLAETLGSYAASVHAGDERAAVGIELNCTHHRAARSGLVSGVARAIHRGNSVATYEIVIDDEAGKRICTARLTCLIRPKPPAA
ncbi:PaaI family thioesterase [Mobilicoccus caccae]|uniref:Thioesterase domain-containing protein n=1 Tax=Mobilicoccus caccae TaxID=1859295 RepID=A0ABQ6IRU9_9MICO|nr:hypothetical protein GCM10025883_14940 [Mobilicoccus caccae]